MILVTGATGNVGREVVKLLLDSGAEVGAITRDPSSAAVVAGARAVGGDASRPKTLAPGLGSSLASYAHQPGPSSDTVQRVLGRPALTFAQWAAGHATAFQN